MSTDIVRHQPGASVSRPGGALSLAHMTPQEAWKFAEVLSGSSLLPGQYRGNPSSVLWALEYGRAIGLDVITTIQSVHVIQGRATASADLMASLTRRAGHRMRITGDDQRAEVTIFRADDPEFAFTVVWTMQRAQKARLANKDIWQEYPAAMLRARAISECVRMACPEVLHGSIYTPEELGAVVDEDGQPVDAAAQAPRPAGPVPSRFDAAAEGDLSGGRDFLSEAAEAPDAEAVRVVYRAAAAARRPKEDLAQIAEVGRQKAAAEEQLPDGGRAVGGAAGADGPPVDDHAAAVADLRAFAAEQGIDDIDRDAYAALGAALEDVSAEAIRALLDQLRGHAA